MVVTEYLGDATHAGLGVREAFLRAGAGRRLEPRTTGSSRARRRRRDAAPAEGVRRPDQQPARGPATIPEELSTTLRVGASGAYEWHVNPSSRPDVDPGAGRDPPLETWTMTCRRAGDPTIFGPVQVSVATRTAGDAGLGRRLRRRSRR